MGYAYCWVEQRTLAVQEIKEFKMGSQKSSPLEVEIDDRYVETLKALLRRKKKKVKRESRERPPTGKGV